MTKIYARVKPIAYSDNSLFDVVNFFVEETYTFLNDYISDFLIEGASFYSTVEEAKNSFVVKKLDENNKPFFSNAKYEYNLQDAIIEFELDDKNNIKALGEVHSIEKIDKTYEVKKVLTPVWKNYTIASDDMSANALSQMNKEFHASDLFKALKPEEIVEVAANSI